MKNHRGVAFGAFVVGISGLLIFEGLGDPAEEGGKKTPTSALLPTGVEEARGRARVLHESIHGILQLVHRDFFAPNDHGFIPSTTLEEVFKDLSRKQKVDVLWLGVEGRTMNVDLQAKDECKRKAVDALRAGKKEFELIEGDRYRRGGAILLHNACLKCDVPKRTSLEDRVAGLVISMPLEKR